MAKHSNVKDSGAVFVIVPNTRKVTVPSSHYVIGTVGEHLSEQITFECPATIDGHDITGCERKYVTWQNVDGEVGHDELVGMTVNGDVASFKWNIRKGLTTSKGVVSFSVHFEDLVSGQTVYKFSTTTCKSCEILETVNAVLGNYEAVYVADDTLVFADYNAVTDGSLRLETNGLIPEGTLQITANGSYAVGEYAEVEVEIADAIPQITVSQDGVITASTPADFNDHTLSSLDDPDFKAENIKHGVNIFGIDGKCPFVEYVTGQIINDAIGLITVHIFGWSALNPNPNYQTYDVLGGKAMGASCPRDSLIAINTGGELISIESGAKIIDSIAFNLYVIKLTESNFKIIVSDRG